MIKDTEAPFVAVGGLENRSPGESRPPGFSFATDFGHGEALHYAPGMRESSASGARNCGETCTATGAKITAKCEEPTKKR